jgi:hypothetical protein
MIKKYPVTGICLSLLMLGNVCHLEAAQFNLSKDVTLDADVELKYSGAWRMKDQDSKLLGINADDGNRSFDKGDMINNKYSVIADVDLNYKNKLGIFVRPRAFYDFAYNTNSANDSLTNNNLSLYGGSLSSSNQYSDETLDRHRDEAELLDYFAYGSFNIGKSSYLDLRIGSQVVSWGESLYLQNSISSAMSPIDATATNAPGVALKEIFLPVEQIAATVDMNSKISVSAYYQWEWDKSRLDEQGSYFSVTDGLDKAGERLLTGISDTAFDKTGYDNPSDSGQFGLGARYIAESLADTEFGLYYVNYHDKYPQLIGTPFAGTFSPTGQLLNDFVTGDGWGDPGLNYADLYGYEVAYAEDIHLIGASFGARIGEANVSGEVSYRHDVPIAIKQTSQSYTHPLYGPIDVPNLLGFNYVSGDAVQVQVSVIRIYGLTALWDQMTIKGEVGLNTVFDYGDDDLLNDETAWGGTVEVSTDYYQVLKGLDMTPSINYEFNPDGTSSLAASFEEDADSMSLGVDFTYLIDYRFGVEYVTFLGGADDNAKEDRDYLGVSFTYMF